MQPHHPSRFASAYDPDDAAYRVAVLVQMAGGLVFAAGVPRFLEEFDPSVEDRAGRTGAVRYAVGIAA